MNGKNLFCKNLNKIKEKYTVNNKQVSIVKIF